MARAISSTRMMCVLVAAFAFAGIMPTASGDERPEGPSMVLHYRRAAETWTEALPIGNGRLGAMVFGGTGSERIALNEDTVWAGERRDRNNPEALEEPARSPATAPGRQARRGRGPGRADDDRRSETACPPTSRWATSDSRFPGHDRVDDYRRELDLDRAIVRVSYRVGDATFRREVFASAVDHVLVVRLTCDRPGRLTFSATLDREQDARAEAIAPDRVLLRGEAIARDERHRERAEGRRQVLGRPPRRRGRRARVHGRRPGRGP